MLAALVFVHFSLLPGSVCVCVRVCVCACIYIHVVAMCKNVVLCGCGMLQRSISYFLATRSSQMNVEAASDVDPKY